MLNAWLQNSLNSDRTAKQETSMDGMNPITPIISTWPQPCEAPRASSWIHSAALMAIIVVATLMTILVLDYVGIQLPAGSEQLTWPPLG